VLLSAKDRYECSSHQDRKCTGEAPDVCDAGYRHRLLHHDPDGLQQWEGDQAEYRRCTDQKRIADLEAEQHREAAETDQDGEPIADRDLSSSDAGRVSEIERYSGLFPKSAYNEQKIGDLQKSNLCGWLGDDSSIKMCKAAEPVIYTVSGGLTGSAILGLVGMLLRKRKKYKELEEAANALRGNLCHAAFKEGGNWLGKEEAVRATQASLERLNSNADVDNFSLRNSTTKIGAEVKVFLERYEKQFELKDGQSNIVQGQINELIKENVPRLRRKLEMFRR
jgi:hypothetical protein